MNPEEIQTAAPAQGSAGTTTSSGPHCRIREIDDPETYANSTIDIFDSGSGGMVTTAFPPGRATFLSPLCAPLR